MIVSGPASVSMPRLLPSSSKPVTTYACEPSGAIFEVVGEMVSDDGGGSMVTLTVFFAVAVPLAALTVRVNVKVSGVEPMLIPKNVRSVVCPVMHVVNRGNPWSGGEAVILQRPPCVVAAVSVTKPP